MFEDLLKNDIYREVVNFLSEKNLSELSFVVGGTLRDLLLKREIKDIDFAIKGDTIKLAKEFSKKIEGTFVLLDEHFSIGRIVKGNITIDFSEIRGKSIESDLMERDFTINAIAFSIASNKIIDPLNGIGDIEKKKIRMVNEENLKIDPLRILRAYRFNSTLHFDIENKTRDALRRNAPLLRITAKERIKEEIWKIFATDFSLKTVELMLDDEIFNSVFKFSEILKPKYNTKALSIIEEVLRKPENIFSNFKINQPYIKVCLKFAALFGFQATQLIRQIKPSKREDRFVEKLIEAEKSLRKIENLFDKVNFIRQYESIFYPALIYSMSTDPLATSRLWFYREMEGFYKRVYLKNKKKTPLIRGDDLIDMGMEPSPTIGHLLERVELLTLAGKLSNKEDALEYIRNYQNLRQKT
ncbi:hypothetical protein [Thermodesulfovibrio sp.]|uniref:hypothetical protein n=1 Tax=Thermodesulfovibrio sp. TaxID=2067987 RepID=UPI0030975E96